MQVRKKWTALFLAVGVAGSLAACGTGSSADDGPARRRRDADDGAGPLGR